MEQKGGWWQSEPEFEDWKRAFQTPSGKFEFYSQEIARRLSQAFPDRGALGVHLSQHGVSASEDDLCLPRWEPPRFLGKPEEFPFVLLPYRAINYAEGGVRHLMRLAALPIVPGNPFQPRIELNPDDAARLGLRDGAAVEVESPAGRQRLHLRIQPGTRPGTAALALGHGTWPPRADEDPTGGYALLCNHGDPLAGILALHGTRVRIKAV
jgi:anaerobic selenocysteine-containing dehydrogenase